MAGDTVGMRRTELERAIRWQLRKAPSDPEKLLSFIGDLIASTIEANNAAIASHLAGGDEVSGDGEEY